MPALYHAGFVGDPGSYQGIALAIPQSLQNQTPLQGLRVEGLAPTTPFARIEATRKAGPVAILN
jgi:hypothetical protein